MRARACPTLPFVMAAGLVNPDAYWLEYVEDVFGPSITQMVAGSVAAVERSISNRLLGHSTLLSR
jgi:roadblock/LC7 domain-containing protein